MFIESELHRQSRKHLRMQIKCLIVFIALLGSSATADNPRQLKAQIETLKRSAAPKWSAGISRLFAENIAIEVGLTDDDADGVVIWRNYPKQSSHILTQRSARYEHVWAANQKYRFEITRRGTGSPFSVRALDDQDVAPKLGMMVPQWTFFDMPLIAILDETLFQLDAVLKEASGQVRIDLHTIRDFTIDRPPYIYFRNNQRAGTKFTLWVNPSRSWQLTRATSEGPGPGIVWEQTVDLRDSGEVTGHVMGRFGKNLERDYLYTAREIVVPVYAETEFLLSHYGLSESTAGYLMGSRRYILVFCGLFFGAILFRILASVLKRRQAKDG